MLYGYPPFGMFFPSFHVPTQKLMRRRSVVSKSRQVTRQKVMSIVLPFLPRHKLTAPLLLQILNWRQSLRFPPKPRVSREAQDLILSLLCEKDARIGSRSTGRPNSVIQRQRSGFLNVAGATGGLAGVANDGADEIKNHPWFKGIEWSTLHLQAPPFVPQLKSETDTRYFEDDIEAVSQSFLPTLLVKPR